MRVHRFLWLFLLLSASGYSYSQQGLERYGKKIPFPADSLVKINTERMGSLEKLVKSAGPSKIFLITSMDRRNSGDLFAMAKLLKRDLYRLNTTIVVSANAGETERNLRQVFDLASGKSFILFIDDADDVFSSRPDGESIANMIQIMVDRKEIPVIIFCRSNCLEKFRKIQVTLVD